MFTGPEGDAMVGDQCSVIRQLRSHEWETRRGRFRNVLLPDLSGLLNTRGLGL